MKYTTLNYEGYEQYLIAESFDHFGVEALMYTFEFDNEYGASVIKHQHSYGSEEDLFELAILYNDRVVYDTEIASDVIGYLNNDEVIDLLKQIKELERRD